MITKHNSHTHAQLQNEKFYEIEDTETHFELMKRERSVNEVCQPFTEYMHALQSTVGFFLNLENLYEASLSQ